ncbi:endo-1,3(4)-beta-glucanase Ecym_2674 [Eremothecium cymbalariae DBVPG|uniref:glucan endo-1,3-beta-D-glucosidase n=1 Tax=Eremothecium cymbalariae (strain CBS 270.75 / DBVPG 7215 / KCTC 17166 / NRRL Y-17582) TaxID=931890 RepID=G8JNV9_ERECY|nr:Hypothetical protein Ecym_2674 [Eremothecium cymbalariae DBVPG\
MLFLNFLLYAGLASSMFTYFNIYFSFHYVFNTIVPTPTIPSMELLPPEPTGVANPNDYSDVSIPEDSDSSDKYSPIDLFKPIAIDDPPSIFPRYQSALDLPPGVSNDGPYGTNEFYTNLIVGSQNQRAFVLPYVVWKHRSDGFGLAVSHTVKYPNLIGYSGAGRFSSINSTTAVADLVFSAHSFTESRSLFEVSELGPSSCRVTIRDRATSDYLDIPLVQGMGFTTGIYHGSLVAKLHSEVGFKRLIKEYSGDTVIGTSKYRITLNNGVQWLVYVSFPREYLFRYFDFWFHLKIFDAKTIIASSPMSGLIIQVAEAPKDRNMEISYDRSAGMYVTKFELQGVSDRTRAEYSFEYTTIGDSKSGLPIVFALPHHLRMLTPESLAATTNIQCQTNTKGIMTGFLTKSLKFVNHLESKVSWLPYNSQADLKYSSKQLNLLSRVANKELQVDVLSSITGLNTYFGGKIIDKFAYILLTVSEILDDKNLTLKALDSMKSVFDVLLANKQTYPLFYDIKFGGVASTADLGSYQSFIDFGNTYYNDHHFHFAYLIHAAAVIGYVDGKHNGTWAHDNKEWVNALIRDVANPSNEDTYFPVSRMFDWYHGHSWASGLYENPRGRNQESSSEDLNFAYAMKMWGKVIGDTSMELRGDLMISIMKESFNSYYLYSDDNEIEPAQLVKNKVSGILFEDMIDYTTYFGTNIEYIHGIHMLPIIPASSETRGPKFVAEEWNQKLSGIVDELNTGWRSILELNRALYDPKASYNFFAQKNVSYADYLDSGLSRTWALAFSGGLANTSDLL